MTGFSAHVNFPQSCHLSAKIAWRPTFVLYISPLSRFNTYTTTISSGFNSTELLSGISVPIFKCDFSKIPWVRGEIILADF